MFFCSRFIFPWELLSFLFFVVRYDKSEFEGFSWEGFFSYGSLFSDLGNAVFGGRVFFMTDPLFLIWGMWYVICFCVITI